MIDKNSSDEFHKVAQKQDGADVTVNSSAYLQDLYKKISANPEKLKPVTPQ